MERELFNEIGETLYGLAWSEPLAQHLGVPESFIHDWSAGLHDVPEYIKKKLYLELRDRGNKILVLILTLED